ncbi:hypothetical protein J3F83DRAFT_772091 [Trichoderma novae-zelandiae]
MLPSIMAVTMDSEASLHVHLLELLQNATRRSNTSPNLLARPQLESKAEQECVRIRQRILSYLDNGDLNRAIHASPLLFQAFRPKRKQLLLSTLFNTLGPAILEAFAVHRTASVDFQASRAGEKVAALFLRALEQHRQRPSLLFELCTFFSEDDLVQIAAFHSKVVLPFALSLMSSMGGGSGMHEPVSDAEVARFQLVFYRDRLDSNLFGKVQSQAPQNGIGDYELRRHTQAVA